MEAKGTIANDKEETEGKIEEDSTAAIAASEGAPKTEAKKEAAEPKSSSIEKSQPKSKFRAGKNIALALFFFVALFFFRFISYSKPSFGYDLPIPYIWNASFKRMISTFLSQKDHDQFLLLFGPHSFGKTRAIREVSQASDRCFFNFDFRVISPTSTLKDIRKIMQSQIINSLLRFQPSPNMQLDSVIQKITTLMFIQRSPVERNISIVFSNNQIQKIANALCQIAQGIETDPSMAFRILFDAIDSISPMQPVITLIHPENLASSELTEVKEVYPLLLQCLIEFACTLRATPIIVEVSDQRYLIDKFINHPSVRKFYVAGFSLNEAKSALLNDKIFTTKELTAIYNRFDGAGYAFSQVRDYAREGTTVNDAISLVVNSETEKLSIVLFGAEKLERVRFLKELSQKKELPLGGDVCSYLLKSGVITETQDAKHVVFQSKSLKKIFDDNFSK